MKRKRSHIGCLFWVALILLVIVVFLFNRPKIDQVLKATGLTTLVTKTPAQPKAPTVRRGPLVETSPEVNVKPGIPSGPSANGAPKETSGRNGAPSKTVTKTRTPASPRSQTEKSTGSSAPETQKKVATKSIERSFELYFIKVTTAGKVELAPTPQRITFVDSPLTKTFESLLAGVPSSDQSNGVRSLIPEGTKLLSASVRSGTAYLDFNDRFRFNPYGIQGYDAQLKQVVYTATQFQTVKRVQILLDGKVRRFLSSEGIPIDKPLDRSSFAG